MQELGEYQILKMTDEHKETTESDSAETETETEDNKEEEE